MSTSSNATAEISGSALVTKVIMGIIFTGFTLLTVFGNLLVVVVVFRERYLRTIINFFIVSLAFADLTMGTIVMPFATLSYLSEDVWWFGEDWCDVWHAFDVLSSTASILNLCMIAVERYWATENPITYSRRVNKHRCLLLVAGIWISSGLISFPAIAWWRASAPPPSPNNTFTCVFTEDSAYLIVSAIISFYIPLVTMVIVYRKIYITASTLVKSINEGRKIVRCNSEPSKRPFLRIFSSSALSPSRAGNPLQAGVHPLSEMREKSSVHENVLVMRIHRGGAPTAASSSHVVGTSSLEGMGDSGESGKSTNNPPSRSGCNCKEQTARRCPTTLPPHQTPTPVLRRNQNLVSQVTPTNIGERKNSRSAPETPGHSRILNSLPQRLRPNGSFGVSHRFRRFAHEQKAAKTLGIVMGIFIFCWLPFFVCSTLSAIFKGIFAPYESTLFLVVTWLGYTNSCVNPLIYARSMRDFRRAFLRVSHECCSCSRWWRDKFCYGLCPRRGHPSRNRCPQHSHCNGTALSDWERQEAGYWSYNASWANINNSTAGLSCSMARNGVIQTAASPQGTLASPVMKVITAVHSHSSSPVRGFK